MLCPPYLAIVDDDPAISTALKRLLKAVPLEVRVFAAGGDFLRAVEERVPDAASFDVQMPEISGLDLQEALHARGLAVPIIFITAFDDAEVQGRALAQGAVGFIAKPFARRTILDLVAVALKQESKAGTGLKLRLQPRATDRFPAAPALGLTDFALSELRACPFCNGYPRQDQISWVDPTGRQCFQARIMCPRCHAEVTADPGRVFINAVSAANDAMTRWNRRDAREQNLNNAKLRP